MTGCGECTVLFGGWDGTRVSAETWLYELGQWRQGNAGPPGRRLHAMCEAGFQYAVTFGGIDQNGAYLNDAWIYDSSRWTSLASTNRPPARAGHTLAFDSARGRVILFGGRNATGELGDTWEYEFYVGWRQVMTPLAPRPRSGHAMAYDIYRARVVLSGGSNQGQLLGDVWEFDGSAWVQRATPSSPGARRSHALAYDWRNQQVVLFGGEALAPVDGYVDTWTYSTTRPATVTAFGTRCARVKVMRVETQPWLGGTFVVEVFSADLGVAIVGGSRTAWGSVPLPFDLGAIGLTGCNLYTSIDVTIPLLSFGNGHLLAQVPLPLQPQLVGQTLYLQNVVLRNGMPLGTTEALALVLGLR